MLGREVPAESAEAQALSSFCSGALLHPFEGGRVFGGRLGGRVFNRGKPSVADGQAVGWDRGPPRHIPQALLLIT